MSTCWHMLNGGEVFNTGVAQNVLETSITDSRFKINFQSPGQFAHFPSGICPMPRLRQYTYPVPHPGLGWRGRGLKEEQGK